MVRVGINFDEISDDLGVALKVMEDCDVEFGELRTVGGKNFVFWSDEEVDTYKGRITEAGVELIAAATPLFKWYRNPDDADVKHDSFGFNPRLSEEDKTAVIDRALLIADRLNIRRLRIFSGLGKAENAGKVFAQDPLLDYALQRADEYGIDLYLENEPVCIVSHTDEMLDMLVSNQHPRLKLWLDVANLVELDEEVDQHLIDKVKSRLGYVHVKDFIIEDGKKRYVPVGQGKIDYATILGLIIDSVDDIIITVETHAAPADKVVASIESIKATKAIVETIAG